MLHHGKGKKSQQLTMVHVEPTMERIDYRSLVNLYILSSNLRRCVVDITTKTTTS